MGTWAAASILFFSAESYSAEFRSAEVLARVTEPARRASAEPPTSGFELQWDAPAECPTRDDAAAAVQELLGAAAEPSATTVRADVVIEGGDGRYAMRLRVGEGARELVGESCDELTATAAFIVAIAIDPRVLARAAPPAEPAIVASPLPAELAPTPQPEEPRGSIAPRPPSVADDTAPRTGAPPLRLGGRVVAGVGLGPSPAVTASVAASVALAARRFRVELDGHYWAPSERRSTNNREVAVRAQLWTVGLRGCGVVGTDRIEVPLCAVTQAGAIHADGLGDLVPRRARQPWVGVGAGAMILGWVRPQIGLVCGVDVLGSVVRGGFRSEPSGDIDRVGPVAFTGLCGLAWRRNPPGVLDSRRAGQPQG